MILSIRLKNIYVNAIMIAFNHVILFDCRKGLNMQFFNNNENNQNNFNVNANNYSQYYTSQTNILTTDFRNYMTKMFAIVGLGVLVSTLIAYYVSSNFLTIFFKFGRNTMYIMYGVMIAQIFSVIYLSYKLARGISFGFALAMFIFYTALTGITLSSVALLYTGKEIFHAFAVSGLFFIALCIIGHITNYKMLTFGKTLGFALIFFLIVQVVSMLFFPSALNSPIFDLIAIAIFAFYTVYDFQRVKYLFTLANTTEEKNRIMISGALNLYIDFLNLFIRILSLLSRKN